MTRMAPAQYRIHGHEKPQKTASQPPPILGIAAPPASNAAIPLIVIVSDHGKITVTLNGQLANEAKTTDDLTGYIGLQSEGGATEFRKIELTPIED